jgi:hypothetical protein
MLATVLLLLAQAGSTDQTAGSTAPAPKTPPQKPGLTLTEPIACRKITGYEDYVVLDPPELSQDAKLLIYTRPLGHTYVLTKERKYQAHLVEDVAIRRKGQKKPIWTRKKVVDLLVEFDQPPLYLYLGTSIGPKDLKPGEYEAELIVTDVLTDDPPATQVLEFKVIASRPREPATSSP